MSKNIKVLAGLVGAVVGLGFYLAFLFLGYSVLFCLVAAAAAGLSGGAVFYGWKSEEPAKQGRLRKVRLSRRFRLSRRPRVVEAQKRLIELRAKRSAKKNEEEERKPATS
ncbi:MAG: hypothetical protein SW833_27065 [Cyanobacteriota bacterium]|nr:hypothetical protein [Cyanobacteriota bacterium]